MEMLQNYKTVLWGLNLPERLTPSSLPLDPHFHPAAATKETFFFQELLNTAITTLLYLIAVIVQFCSIGPAPQRNIAAGVSQPALPLPPSFFISPYWQKLEPCPQSNNII